MGEESPFVLGNNPRDMLCCREAQLRHGREGGCDGIWIRHD